MLTSQIQTQISDHSDRNIPDQSSARGSDKSSARGSNQSGARGGDKFGGHDSNQSSARGGSKFSGRDSNQSSARGGGKFSGRDSNQSSARGGGKLGSQSDNQIGARSDNPIQHQNIRSIPPHMIERQPLSSSIPTTPDCTKNDFTTIYNDGNDGNHSLSCIWISLVQFIKIINPNMSSFTATDLRELVDFPDASMMFELNAISSHGLYLQEICNIFNLNVLNGSTLILCAIILGLCNVGCLFNNTISPV
jgi:hypothetical protein